MTDFFQLIFRFLVSLCLLVPVLAGSFPYGIDTEKDPEEWRPKPTFGEEKTHETLNPSTYARMDHTEHVIKYEINLMYEKLKGQIERNFRMCNRQRRKADNSSSGQPDTLNKKSFRKKKQNKRDKKGNKKKDRKQKGDFNSNDNNN